MSMTTESPPEIILPPAPVLVAEPNTAIMLSADGEIKSLNKNNAALELQNQAPIHCHRPSIIQRLDLEILSGYDILELFVFTHPTRFCLPTPQGVAKALGLDDYSHIDNLTAEESALSLIESATSLLEDISKWHGEKRTEAAALAFNMSRAGWGWGHSVLAALGLPEGLDIAKQRESIKIWKRLENWEDEPLPPPPEETPISNKDILKRLEDMLSSNNNNTNNNIEIRPQQKSYSESIAKAFQPNMGADAPNIVLGEAGTGIGKTLGYLAPATIFAEQNDSTVWISTYTRNLQHQIDDELNRLYDDPIKKQKHIVIRKGRENYLCLLNLEEALNSTQSILGHNTISSSLMARWAAETKFGDLQGGDFPGWLPHLMGSAYTTRLSDKRGECVYAACPHYRKCYIENSIRRARSADIVIANHALVMINAALSNVKEFKAPNKQTNTPKTTPNIPNTQPNIPESPPNTPEDTPESPSYPSVPRIIFDEGHHLFQAADSAFSAHLTGTETAELRRWLLGADSRRSSRAKGLKSRLEDLTIADDKIPQLIEEISHKSRFLPQENWQERLANDTPSGTTETFLLEAKNLTYNRSQNPHSPYDLEVHAHPTPENLLTSATQLKASFKALLTPINKLIKSLNNLLENHGEDYNTEAKRRIESVIRGLERRGNLSLTAWQDMLSSLSKGKDEGFVDWFEVTRSKWSNQNKKPLDSDIGLHRHWVDPSLPFARYVLQESKGIAITSATLTDSKPEALEPEKTPSHITDWQTARRDCGTSHLVKKAHEYEFSSPFDYPKNVKIYIVNDVPLNNQAQVAGAYRALFLASKGGALGLFTAISRLRATHATIAKTLEQNGLNLLSQHIDPFPVATLVDIFKAQKNSILLGTDALRDGVDVPGESLKMVILDRTPWARPSILHRARREAFGGRAYDEIFARMRLKQAFGRLIRRKTDRGVFICLDNRLPTKLLSAFPEGIEIKRIGLQEAVMSASNFIHNPDNKEESL